MIAKEIEILNGYPLSLVLWKSKLNQSKRKNFKNPLSFVVQKTERFSSYQKIRDSPRTGKIYIGKKRLVRRLSCKQCSIIAGKSLELKVWIKLLGFASSLLIGVFGVVYQ